MKIFLVIPSLKQGGAERVISQLANEFSRFENVEVHIVLLTKTPDAYVVDKRVIIHRLNFENRGVVQKFFSELRVLFQLRSLFSEYRPNAILSFMTKYNSFVLIASAFLALRVYVSDRSNPLKRVPLITSFLRKLTYRYAKGIIAQTDFSRDFLLREIHNPNIIVIPNPLKRVNLFSDIPREKLILNIGRLVPEKGQKYLIEAFSRLNLIDWKLVIIGEGRLREELENRIRELQLENNIKLPGAVDDVDLWLARASIFAFPSISEGFPNALAEAMSAGLPCVCFDCDAGPRDLIIPGETGFLIEKLNVYSFASALSYLVNNEQERYRVGAKSLVIRDILSSTEIAKKYYNFITN